MRLSVEISFDELLKYVRELSVREKERLVAEIQQELPLKKQEPAPNALQNLLLQGPTWSDAEYQDFMKVKKP